MTNKYIVRDCPICGQTISIPSGKDIPPKIGYIKTKRRTVVLVHKNCMKVRKQNGHIKSKEEH